MIVILQRLLQFLVVVGFIFVIAKPEVLPNPWQTMAENVHVLVVGEEDTWDSFQSTWRNRFEDAGSLIPWFKTLATRIPPDPPQITADGVLELLNLIIITQPVDKYEQIKSDFFASPPPSASEASLYNEQHE